MAFRPSFFHAFRPTNHVAWEPAPASRHLWSSVSWTTWHLGIVSLSTSRADPRPAGVCHCWVSTFMYVWYFLGYPIFDTPIGDPQAVWYGCEMQSGWIIIGCPKFEVQSPCSLHTTMSWVYALPYLHYPAIFPLNTQRISRYPHCRPQCMAWSRINRNKELKYNKPHLVVQLESLVGMTMEITISWDMTLKKLWLYTESTTGTGTSQVIPHNEPTLHPGFHFRLALLVPLGMRFLAEKLMFSRTVSLDAIRQGPEKRGQLPF